MMESFAFRCTVSMASLCHGVLEIADVYKALNLGQAEMSRIDIRQFGGVPKPRQLPT